MKSQNRLIDSKYLKTYNLITYKAKQTRTRGKYRPFLITGIDSTKQTITIIPITHSAPNPKSPYSRFHYEKKEILPKSDLKKMQIARDLGFRPTDPRAYDPAIQKKQKQKYQRPSAQQIKREYGPDL